MEHIVIATQMIREKSNQIILCTVQRTNTLTHLKCCSLLKTTLSALDCNACINSEESLLWLTNDMMDFSYMLDGLIENFVILYFSISGLMCLP